MVVKAKFREDDMVAQAPPPHLPHPAPTCNPPPALGAIFVSPPAPPGSLSPVLTESAARALGQVETLSGVRDVTFACVAPSPRSRATVVAVQNVERNWSLSFVFVLFVFRCRRCVSRLLEMQTQVCGALPAPSRLE